MRPALSPLSVCLTVLRMDLDSGAALTAKHYNSVAGIAVQWGTRRSRRLICDLCNCKHLGSTLGCCAGHPLSSHHIANILVSVSFLGSVLPLGKLPSRHHSVPHSRLCIHRPHTHKHVCVRRCTSTFMLYCVDMLAFVHMCVCVCAQRVGWSVRR